MLVKQKGKIAVVGLIMAPLIYRCIFIHLLTACHMNYFLLFKKKKPPHLYGRLETELLYKMEEASIGVMEWRRGSPYEEANCKTK